MLKMIIAFIVFIIILLLYLHVQFHLKTSEEVEMYEVDWPSKEKLEQVCDLRQPLLFDFDCQDIISYINVPNILSYHSSPEIKIRNVNNTDSNSELYMPLPFGSAVKLFKEDKSGLYFSEKNMDFLQETGLIKVLKSNDTILQPYMTSNTYYDIMLGSRNSYTPFRYELGYRNYLLLTHGTAQIKLAPPSSEKYLYLNKDYENMEFSSPINPWNPEAKYSTDFSKVKCIDFTLTPCKTLYIPAYWWYSVKFNTFDTSICVFKYRTYMNSFTIMPHLCLHLLQIQNIKRRVAKKFVASPTKEEVMVESSLCEEKKVIEELTVNNNIILTEAKAKHQEDNQDNQDNQKDNQEQVNDTMEEINTNEGQEIVTFKTDL